MTLLRPDLRLHSGQSLLLLKLLSPLLSSGHPQLTKLAVIGQPALEKQMAQQRRVSLESKAQDGKEKVMGIRCG